MIENIYLQLLEELQDIEAEDIAWEISDIYGVFPWWDIYDWSGDHERDGENLKNDIEFLLKYLISGKKTIPEHANGICKGDKEFDLMVDIDNYQETKFKKFCERIIEGGAQ